MGLFDLFSNDTAETAAAQKIAGLNAGYADASKLLGQGRDAITTNYDAAYKPWETLFNQSQGGSQAYGDAAGANGSAGFARAVDNFHTGPGYNFQFGQGLQALDRGAASRGNVTSGNTLTAEQQLGTGLANQSFKDYMAGLQPYLGQGTAAAAGGSAVKTGEGTALNNSYGNQGQLSYQTQAGIGNANAAATMNNYNVGANQFGALMGIANLGASAFGGGLGSIGGLGSTGASNIGSFFSPSGSNPFNSNGSRNTMAYG